MAFTSVLKRAIRAAVAGPRRNGSDVDSRRELWRLNRRHYGALGHHKKGAVDRRRRQVKIWRRSYDIIQRLRSGDPNRRREILVTASLKPGEVPY
jgi:bisphosphoglycerate-dependent phosphoglycerate mutase